MTSYDQLIVICVHNCLEFHMMKTGDPYYGLPFFQDYFLFSTFNLTVRRDLKTILVRRADAMLSVRKMCKFEDLFIPLYSILGRGTGVKRVV